MDSPTIGGLAAPKPRRRGTGRLRVGIVGAGDISVNHLTAWATAERAEVVAVCDRLPDRAAARAKAFGIKTVLTDAKAMIETMDLDVVDVATWRDSHAAMVDLAADAGCDVLCQKPLAPTLAEAQALVTAVAGRVRLMVNENRRFAARFRAIAAWIGEGRLGDLRQCNMIMHRAGLLKDASGRRPAVERTAGMAQERRLLVQETFIHQIDVLRYLIGPMRVVAARMLNTDPELPGETLATIMMESAGQAPIVLAGSMVAPGFGTAVSDRLELIGTRASIVLDGDRLSLLGDQPEQRVFDMKADYQACFDNAARHFVDCLWNGIPFESDAADNLETLRLVEDAYIAAGRGASR